MGLSESLRNKMHGVQRTFGLRGDPSRAPESDPGEPGFYVGPYNAANVHVTFPEDRIKELEKPTSQVPVVTERRLQESHVFDETHKTYVDAILATASSLQDAKDNTVRVIELTSGATSRFLTMRWGGDAESYGVQVWHRMEEEKEMTTINYTVPRSEEKRGWSNMFAFMSANRENFAQQFALAKGKAQMSLDTHNLADPQNPKLNLHEGFLFPPGAQEEREKWLKEQQEAAEKAAADIAKPLSIEVFDAMQIEEPMAAAE